MIGGRGLAAAALLLTLFAFGAIARAEVVQQGDVRVGFDGKLAPQSLPRTTPVPARVSFGGHLSYSGSKRPSLTKMSIAINRYGRIDPGGLPICDVDDIQPATNANALAVCRKSLVGEGRFTAKVQYEGQSVIRSAGKIYAFNGRANGRPAILAHVFGKLPGLTSYTFPFVIRRSAGTFGTTLKATMPASVSRKGYVTGISLTLGRTFSFHGKRHSYITAFCPAPAGISKVSYPLARGSFLFKGGRTLTKTLHRSCRAAR